MSMRLLAVAALIALAHQVQPEAPAREVAVTIDDLPTNRSWGMISKSRRKQPGRCWPAQRNQVPAIGFVNEGKLRSGRAGRSAAGGVVTAMARRGIGASAITRSPTWTLHLDALHEYERQVLEGERITSELLRERGKRTRYFRHPFFHTGRSAPERQQFEAFLRRHGYTVAPITIDNYDYVFAAAYDRAGARHDAKAQERSRTRTCRTWKR